MTNDTDAIPPRPDVLAALLRVVYPGDPKALLSAALRTPTVYGLDPGYLGLLASTLRTLRRNEPSTPSATKRPEASDDDPDSGVPAVRA